MLLFLIVNIIAIFIFINNQKIKQTPIQTSEPVILTEEERIQFIFKDELNTDKKTE